jgi:hypothetical protein
MQSNGFRKLQHQIKWKTQDSPPNEPLALMRSHRHQEAVETFLTVILCAQFGIARSLEKKEKLLMHFSDLNQLMKHVSVFLGLIIHKLYAPRSALLLFEVRLWQIIKQKKN